MESRNMFSMCRLCLCENECFINIFSVNDWHGYVAAKVITDLLHFEVSKEDGYPHVICPTCLNKLTDFKVFKEQCQTSKVTYDNVFANDETLIDSETDGVEIVSVKVEPNDVVLDDNDDVLSKESVCGDDTDEEQLRGYSPEVPLVEIKSESVDIMDNAGEHSKSTATSSPQHCRTPSPASASELPKIRKRKSITMDQKLEIIQKLEAGVTPSALARTYSLNESTIRTIRKNASKTKEVEVSLGSFGGRKTSVARSMGIEKMERLLAMWLEEKQWMGVAPSSTVVREKALRIYNRLQEEEGSSSVGEPFLASKGWYAKFCKRRELQNANLTGDDGEMSVEFQSSVLASPERSTSPLLPNYGPTLKRKVITLGRKLEIIEKLESGVSPAALGRVYQMNESSIRTIRKSAARIKESLARSSAVDAKQTQRVRNPLIEEMERCLADWMEEQTQIGHPPNSGEARRKALKIYVSLKKEKDFGSNVEPFLASKGWYHRFCKRKNIHGAKLEMNDDSMSYEGS